MLITMYWNNAQIGNERGDVHNQNIALIQEYNTIKEV